MFTGILAGVTWVLETVVLGIALGMSPFVSTPQAVLLAPFIGTFLHDTFSALFMFLYNTVKGNLKPIFAVLKSKSHGIEYYIYCVGNCFDGYRIQRLQRFGSLNGPMCCGGCCMRYPFRNGYEKASKKTKQ